MKVIVDSRLRIARDEIPEMMLTELCAEFTRRNPLYQRQQKMGFRVTESPIIETYYLTATELTLPRGATALLRKYAATYNVALTWVDRRTEGRQDLAGQIPPHRLTLYDYQQDARERMIAGVNCLLRAPTGSGKTSIAIGVASQLNLPTLIIVWSSALGAQWVDRIQSELGIDHSEIGYVGSGRFDIRPITIAMQQSLRDVLRRRVVGGSFGVVICDEVQRFAAKTFIDVVDELPARYRFGFSADESRKDGKEFLIYDMFGKIAADISRKVLESKGTVTPVKVVLIPTEYRAPWYIEQREKYGTKVGWKTVVPDFGRLLDEMMVDRDRNLLIRDLMDPAHNNKQTLVFTHRREHVFLIESLATELLESCGRLVGGEDDAQLFDQTAGDIRLGTLRLAVGTYQAIGQGLDLPSVEVGIACTPIHSNRQFFGQVRGRLCRASPGKDHGVLFYLWDRHVFGDAPLRNMLRWNDGNVEVWEGGSQIDGKRYLR